jgi:Domain of unknown function (DUF397).
VSERGGSETRGVNWRKASVSFDREACVEVRGDLGAMRDSKCGELGTPLVVGVTGMRALVRKTRELGATWDGRDA